MTSVRTQTVALQERKGKALELLASGEQSTKSAELKKQIEAIDPKSPRRREIDRLKALCNQVERYNDPSQPKRRFGSMPTFDRRTSAAANSQNYRGSRGRSS